MADLATMFGAGAGATFMGLPACDDLGATAGKVVLIGAGACTSYATVGAYCAGAPAAIRAAGAAFSASLEHENFDLGGPSFPAGNAVDAGDLPVVDGEGAANRARIGAAVAQVLAAGGVPVLLGGDDSVPLPMIEAFGARGREVTILQVDAHIDWRDEVAGERLGLSSTMRRASEMAHVGRMVQVGQRGIGSARPGDLADARARGVVMVPGREVADRGFARAVEAIPEGAEVILCFDCDALDPAIMPAVIGRTAGGLSYAQALGLVEAVAARARIVAVDLVEFMPGRDVDGLGAMLAAQLLAALMGIVARQIRAPGAEGGAHRFGTGLRRRRRAAAAATCPAPGRWAIRAARSQEKKGSGHASSGGHGDRAGHAAGVGRRGDLAAADRRAVRGRADHPVRCQQRGDQIRLRGAARRRQRTAASTPTTGWSRRNSARSTTSSSTASPRRCRRCAMPAGTMPRKRKSCAPG